MIDILPNEISNQFVGRVQCLLKESNNDMVKFLSQSWEALEELLRREMH